VIVKKTIRLLLIEDDPDDILLLREMLVEASARRHLGTKYELECAESLSEGLSCIGKSAYDLVLLDLSLPDSQGLDTLGRVHREAPGTPIVMLTGSCDSTVRAKAIQGGAQDYLVKGQTDSNLLARTIDYAIERHRILDELKTKTQEALANEARFKIIVEKNTDGIIVVDTKGNMRFANPAAQTLFNRTSEDLLEEPFGFPLSGGETTEVDIIRKGGKVALAELRIVETEWEGESVFLACLHDVTEHKKLLAELEATRRQQLKTKDQFLSHISHELRSPLATIHEFITILLDGIAGAISSEQREYLEIVFRNVVQLGRMITDLLSITRSDAGTLSVEPCSMNLPENIEHTLDSVRTSANEKNIVISFDQDGALPLVYADPSRTQEIVTNLIENAIKFTPENGAIALRARRFDEDPEFVMVSVADTGCGIGLEDQERIFDYMQQGENSKDICRKGLGIGLYVCREFVSRQGGRIWLESQPGKGSIFYFILPIFSLEHILLTRLTEVHLSNPTSLIAADVAPSSKLPSETLDKQMLSEIQRLLQKCILPLTDIHLPTMPYPDDREGQVFFVLVSTDDKGAERVVQRIKDQLVILNDTQNLRLDIRVSFSMMNILEGEELTMERHAKEVAENIKQRMKTVNNPDSTSFIDANVPT